MTKNIKTLKECFEFVKKTKKNKLVEKISAGLYVCYCVLGIPIIIKHFSPNFKIKFYIYNIPLLSLSRKPRVGTIKLNENRAKRIYFNVGSLFFTKNNTGIPRVVAELSKTGLMQSEIEFKPIYADPVTGTYRILNQIDDTRELSEVGDEIDLRKGDVLIHSMINVNELDFNKDFFQQAKKIGIKVLFILYDLIPIDYPEYYKKRDTKLFSKWLEEAAKFDGFLAISNYSKERLMHWSQETKTSIPPVQVFGLGSNFSPSNEDRDTTEKIPVEKPYYLMVGTIEPRKGHEDVLEAFDEYWDKGGQARCVFVGRKGWKVRQIVQRLEHHKEFNHKLFWLKGIEDSVLKKLYNEAEAVIVAAHVEGYGLPIVEALNYKKTVLARDIPIFREIGGEFIQYFKDPSELASLISKGKNSYLQSKDYESKNWHTSFKEMYKAITLIENSI